MQDKNAPKCYAQCIEQDAYPVSEQERQMLSVYRQLDESAQAFMRRAIKALATRDSPNWKKKPR